ncbi:DUF4860 domain-containing protein [Raoultibacter timonensis]|uniref:DUF4860 domain-containing protein n=1 Tax=Raoultibacter timonensis TaxID=1907662 RepID=A0ABM7WLX8_9ACTN|nr:DUF4860 domain-containing protein [Raoultibacter timonensis]BDE97409.1 hypothetical protein CE91St30_27420 [Raoultibacter timonensis]BDF52012.1 hypothetical protein CE91St31_27420 [Raoultibacter timonensis]
MRDTNQLGPLASVPIAISKNDSRSAADKNGRVFGTLFFGVMILALLGLLLLGIRSYSNANSARMEGNDMRLGLSLINNSIHLNDVANAVGVGNGPEGQSLVLTENLDSGSYETRIYSYQGTIVEEYAAAGTAYTPEKARDVVASSTFDFEYANGLLTVYTDQGATRIALRSALSGGDA